jgi:hypothetical protein
MAWLSNQKYKAGHQAESLVVSDFPDEALESEEEFSAF